MHLAVARRLPRLLPLAIAVALLGAGLVVAAGDPAAAQAAPTKVTIKGTAENKWDPARRHREARRDGHLRGRRWGHPPGGLRRRVEPGRRRPLRRLRLRAGADDQGGRLLPGQDSPRPAPIPTSARSTSASARRA